MKQLTNPAVNKVLHSKPPQTKQLKSPEDLKAVFEKERMAAPPLVGRVPNVDYSKEPSPEEKRMIDIWLRIDEQSDKGWGPGGKMIGKRYRYSNHLKALVYDRLFQGGTGTFFDRPGDVPPEGLKPQLNKTIGKVND